MSKKKFVLIDDDGNEYDDLLYKQCRKCTSIKPIDNFYLYVGKRVARCKQCVGEYKRKYSQRPEVKKRLLVYGRKYQQRPDRKEYRSKYHKDHYVKKTDRAFTEV